MAQCRRNYCSEPAVDPRKNRGKYKQYCAKHLEEYQNKRREYDKIQATLPDCVGGCGQKVGLTRTENGETRCIECERKYDEWHQTQNEISAKRDQLFEAKTVEELKEWIWKYAFND